MKKKEILQRINSLAKFMFEKESLINRFNFLISKEQFTSAKILLEKELERIEYKLDYRQSDRDLERYKQCDKLLDLVIDLIISQIDIAYEKGKQINISI